MGSRDEVVEIDSLEKGLLSDNGIEREDDDDDVLYTASFQEKEDNFVQYQTAQWVLYSLLLILAWGIGLFMLLYLPVRSGLHWLLYFVFLAQVTRPVPFPCFGVLKKEKHVLLPSVQDIVIEQGYLQSLFGVYSLRIENVGVRRPPSDDVQIQGVANPSDFRKAVLTRLSNMTNEVFSREASAIEDVQNPKRSLSSITSMSPSKSSRHDLSHSGDQVVLQKLEEVGSSVKRVQALIEEQCGQTSDSLVEENKKIGPLFRAGFDLNLGMQETSTAVSVTSLIGNPEASKMVTESGGCGIPHNFAV
ncbi:hypothetical protein KPL70_027213 [Citrus sinensis]|nr:hypothetical protein KPL70_027213 [Citrus sinensis]